MNKGLVKIISLLIITAAVFSFSSCGSASSPTSGTAGDSGSRGSTDTFLIPKASGGALYESGDITIDTSNISDGYLMTLYEGPADKEKIQIHAPDGEIYTYTVKDKNWQVFPLSAGSGTYTVDALTNVEGDMYFMEGTTSFQADISDEFSPFLYPNQYVWFTEEMEAMSLGKELSDKSTDDLNYVENVYKYVTSNIEYDNDKAANVPTDYIPDIDETLSTGKGICFDYASLMAALLRSQGIPAKLEVGYSGTAYHAWISVYTDETGWVDNIIEFNGSSWSLMDPTLGSNNDSKSVKTYVNDESNYQVKYNY